MIGADACDPALARNVRRRLVKGRCRFEAENLFLRVGPTVVCAENFVRIDLVRESLTVGHDGRAATLLFEAVDIM